MRDEWTKELTHFFSRKSVENQEENEIFLTTKYPKFCKKKKHKGRTIIGVSRISGSKCCILSLKKPLIQQMT